MIQNTKFKPIAIGANNSFKLNVIVGAGQPSNTTLFLNGKQLHSQNHSFSYQLSNLKPADRLYIVTTVSDIPQNPNRIVVEHLLDPVNIKVNYDDSVQEGEVAVNSTRFDFY